MNKREKLLVEKGLDSEMSWSAIGSRGIRFPHCDARILHLPTECFFCKEAVDLQKERELLEVSNTGHANRKWPCPADQARSAKIMNSWPGNRAKTLEDLDKEARELEEFWKESYDAQVPQSVEGTDSKSVK